MVTPSKHGRITRGFIGRRPRARIRGWQLHDFNWGRCDRDFRWYPRRLPRPRLPRRFRSRIQCRTVRGLDTHCRRIVGHVLGLVDGYSDARVGMAVGLTVVGYTFVKVVKKTKTKFGGGEGWRM